MSSRLFQTYPRNEAGRDFVIGDIHGAYNMVARGMRQVGFDEKVDRLFCVGDLVDRGPESHRALEFLAQPYVYAVRGNHDDNFTRLSISEMRVLGGADWNGMGWVCKVSDEKLLAIKNRFEQLPIAIQVDTVRGTVGLVHGDIPRGMRWNEFVGAIEHGDPKVIETALTGRDRLKSHDTSGVDGIDRLYVGHSIQWNGPQRLGNVFAIDCGAIFHEIKIDGVSGSLSMVNMACRTEAICPQGGNVPRNSVMTHADEGLGPFGIYAEPKRRVA